MWYVPPAYAQSNQKSLFLSFEYYMTVKHPTEHHLGATLLEITCCGLIIVQVSYYFLITLMQFARSITEADVYLRNI